MTPHKDELEFIDFLGQLVKSDRLNGAVLGISKQTITNGQSSLNDRQYGILHAEIDKISLKQCPKCHQDVPWPEMFQAMEKGTCAACLP
jgi:hypothetical protein